jgi:hypothetical protein
MAKKHSISSILPQKFRHCWPANNHLCADGNQAASVINRQRHLSLRSLFADAHRWKLNFA